VAAALNLPRFFGRTGPFKPDRGGPRQTRVFPGRLAYSIGRPSVPRAFEFGVVDDPDIRFVSRSSDPAALPARAADGAGLADTVLAAAVSFACHRDVVAGGPPAS
jgi:hypothetical protein